MSNIGRWIGFLESKKKLYLQTNEDHLIKHIVHVHVYYGNELLITLHFHYILLLVYLRIMDFYSKVNHYYFIIGIVGKHLYNYVVVDRCKCTYVVHLEDVTTSIMDLNVQLGIVATF